MRKIAANYIFPVTTAPLKNGILVLDEKNYIIDLIDTKGEFKEIQNLEFYSGVIVPGFVDVFTLLAFSSFSQENFTDCLHSDFTTALRNNMLNIKASPDKIQKGINQLEAYGTAAAVDIFTNNNPSEGKLKSKLNFSDINISMNSLSLQIPSIGAELNGEEFILLNRLILEKNPNFTPSESEMKQCCIGTGSLGTHLKLSVFDELKALQELFPDVNFWELIKWGTINGAKHLRIENEFGSLEIGKKPGLNLLTNLDYPNQKFNESSALKVLV